MNAQKMNLVTTTVQTLRDHSPVAAGMVLNWMKMDWIVTVRNCLEVEQPPIEGLGRLLWCTFGQLDMS